MDHDGTRNGFANEALLEMSQRFSVPLIASGGAGNMQHFADTFINGKADAALAAGIFHYRELAIPDLKQYLFNQNIPVRIV
jgi:cyclase